MELYLIIMSWTGIKVNLHTCFADHLDLDDFRPFKNFLSSRFFTSSRIGADIQRFPAAILFVVLPFLSKKVLVPEAILFI